MRTYSRLSTDEVITLAIAGQDVEAHLYNLSCGGCMVELPGKPLEPGTALDVRLSNSVEIRGEVAWQMGKNTGIAFEVPLHQRVVETFGFDKDAEFEAEDPMDRFGLPLDVGNAASAGSRE